MMVGVPPFYSQNQARMFHLIRTGKIIWPNDCQISNAAKDIIQRVRHPTHIPAAD
jgi:hypothetical protein